MDEPAVIDSGREKAIVELASELQAVPKRRYAQELLEATFHSKTGFIQQKILFGSDIGEKAQVLLHEHYEEGRLKRRSAGNVEELYHADGTVEKTISHGQQKIMHILKNGYYAANGKPAIEIRQGQTVVEEVWYEPVRAPGEPISYGKIHRKPVKRAGVWAYDPARIVTDLSTGRTKEFRYVAGELQDTPDGKPAFLECDKEKVLTEVHVVQGSLHGCPAIRGSLDNGTSYEINADNGVISDVPDVPGVSLQKDRLRLNVHFNSEGQVQYREVNLDLADIPLPSVEECDDAIVMMRDILRSHLLQKMTMSRENEPIFRDPFAGEG